MSKKFKLFFTILIVSSFFIQNVKIIFASPLIVENNKDIFLDEADIPIIMYHKITDISSELNEWAITPEEFEDDLKYIDKLGYETIFISELIDFVNGTKKLPEKPIILTFDDGEVSVFEMAYPILQKYNAKAVIAILTKITDKYSNYDDPYTTEFPNLKWDQIQDMVNSGLVEVQNHSHDLHKEHGAAKKKNESLDVYKKRITEDIDISQKLIQENLKITTTTFAYPFGSYDASSEEVMKELGFSATLTCYTKVNKVTPGNPESLFSLGRILRPHGKSSYDILNKYLEK